MNDDPWVRKYTALIPSAKAHALGVVGFLWNGCEKRLLDLWWLASGLKSGEENGPASAKRPTDLQRAIREGLAAQGAPLEVQSEIKWLIEFYEICRSNRNQLSHYRLHADTNDPDSIKALGIRLVGITTDQSRYSFDDSLAAIRSVADSLVDLMWYFNGTLKWAFHAVEQLERPLKKRKPLPSPPSRPTLPNELKLDPKLFKKLSP